MKFTDGNWLIREGVRTYHPAQAYDLETTDTSVTAYAPAHMIRHRGDTLIGPLITVRLSSPMCDVIQVRLMHYSGERRENLRFPTFPDEGAPVTIETDDGFASLTSGALTARINRANWALDFVSSDGRIVTSSGAKGVGLAEVEGEGAYIHEQLSLGVGECVYGLGERFTAFVKNGQVVDTWNKDGGAGSDQAYKNVPFYITNRGYGVFVNQPENVSFEIGSEKVARVQFSVPGQSLEYFVIYGPTPKEILEKYTALTGRPALPPAWSFGLWLTTSFTTSYDEQTVTSFIQGMADREIPLHVFHFDCFWMREFHWCDFEWDKRVFPDPAGMLTRLKERGLKICVWINPYIAQRSPLFAEGKAGGYLLKRADGSVWQTDQWQPGMGIVDFTNPDACRWFQDKLRALLHQGVDCFKTDFGERIPTDAVYFDGSDPEAMHNFYSYLYNKTVFDLLREERGEGEAVLFARSGTAGSQQFPVHWGGDCASDFEAMSASLRAGLSLCLSGFGFWSHDIGGFEGTPPAEIYKRWVAFGLLSPHSRLHGSSSYRVPWVYDDEAVDVLRFFTQLKCRLMPYLFGAAVEAHQHGVPMMRAMMLEFPGDPACEYLDRQYLLGGSLLVAPVFSQDGSVQYYIPEGRWTEYLTGRTIDGPRWMREEHGFLSLPLLVRPNTVLPLGADDERPDYDFTSGVEFQVYELSDGANVSVSIPTLTGANGATLTVTKNDGKITATLEGSASLWRLRLMGVANIASVDGGSFESGERGALVLPADGARSVTVTV
ncbi:alpha-xylosidase [Capsulimonas corticalis]|uniref:alpha-D-xyloside xylohydrolase n=1 Tax=Capsulimonas corticalis TaxID=2219043 RepID=A0A402CRW3_9BACT|nr:alpha-xylosidase [Capsulimonas corticalis]BDI28238.1 alpha-xylosidase [Capsulimonas corticalis]